MDPENKQLLQQAISTVNVGAKLDFAGRYADAHVFYVEGIGCFERFKTTRDYHASSNVRDLIDQKVQEYRDRDAMLVQYLLSERMAEDFSEVTSEEDEQEQHDVTPTGTIRNRKQQQQQQPLQEVEAC